MKSEWNYWKGKVKGHIAKITLNTKRKLSNFRFILSSFKRKKENGTVSNEGFVWGVLYDPIFHTQSSFLWQGNRNMLSNSHEFMNSKVGGKGDDRG